MDILNLEGTMNFTTVGYNDLNTLSVADVAKDEPNLSPEAYALLKKDIIENGMLNPVIVYKNEVYDGRHRLAVAKEIKCDLKVIETSTMAEAKNLAMSGNRHRRHLSKAQYAMMAAKEYLDGKKSIVIEQSTYILNKYVSVRYVKNAIKIRENDEKIADDVFEGNMSIEEAIAKVNANLAAKALAEAQKNGVVPKQKENYLVTRAKNFLATTINDSVKAEVEAYDKKEKYSKIDLLKEHLFYKHKLIEIIKESTKDIDLNKKLKQIETDLNKALDAEKKQIEADKNNKKTKPKPEVTKNSETPAETPEA